jgi:hypothetical protein
VSDDTDVVIHAPAPEAVEDPLPEMPAITAGNVGEVEDELPFPTQIGEAEGEVAALNTSVWWSLKLMWHQLHPPHMNSL